MLVPMARSGGERVSRTLSALQVGYSQSQGSTEFTVLLRVLISNIVIGDICFGRTSANYR